MAPPYPPREPPPTRWVLPDPRQAGEEDLVAVGADLAPGTLLAAYRSGLFPMGVGEGGSGPTGWWSPAERGVLLPGDAHVSRSLRRALHRYDVTVDTAFAEVVAGCADPSREGSWITADMAAAYGRLHELGWAHSIEVWHEEELVGGLYGVAVGGLFAGESMYHRAPDASKVALVHLDRLVGADGDPRRLVDVQWQTPHLASMGVTRMPREEYLARLVRAAGSADLDWRDGGVPARVAGS